MISAADFQPYFRAIHGYDPFPWQRRLVSNVLGKHEWPRVLDLPTGSGKTSTIDVALFTLAAQPDLFPRRIVLVVDRRVVVDQGHDHALRILEAMRHASPGSILRHVADSLRAIWQAASDDDPFHAAVLRGGMPRDDAWTHRPDWPVVAVSTVDQVGSRLLFRGYGVSPGSRSIHAGLLGNDVLLLLDEVHLSRPFAETLSSISEIWRSWAEPRASIGAIPDRWSVVEMSATPGRTNGESSTFGIDEDDRTDRVLSKRIRAHKQAALREIAVRKNDERREAFARGCAEEAKEILAAGARVVAIVVNRVAMARQVYDLVSVWKHARDEASSIEALLLTGRMRPIDRDSVLADYRDRLMSRENRSSLPRLVVVATQCIEAGADFDFDGMVTECASIDALRQRFGRLDRRGEYGGQAHAVVVAGSDTVGDASDDAVYGDGLTRTWNLLNELAAESGHVDFGIEHFAQEGDAADRAALCVAPEKHAPILLPSHLDAWVQTRPAPSPDPHVSMYLHGADPIRPEVQIVWRADFEESRLSRDQLQSLVDLVDACPPSALEALQVPLGAAKAWLSGDTRTEAFDVADAPQRESSDDEEVRRSAGPSRLALRWAADESEIVDAPRIRPGDTLVVPASYGGIAQSNWAPETTTDDPVADLGDIAQWRQRGRACLRLHRSVLDAALASEDPIPGPSPEGEGDESKLREWLDAATGPDDWAEILEALRQDFEATIFTDGNEENPHRWFVLQAKRRRKRAASIASDDDRASFTSASVDLDEHCLAVSDLAGRFAQNLGLPQPLANDLRLAGQLHDVGKLDPRFQRMLLGGSEFAAARQERALAKSPRGDLDKPAQRRARQLAGLPAGYRHELLSARLVQNHEVLSKANDPDLVLHLIASHHGYARPFAPPVADENTCSVDARSNDEHYVGTTDHRFEQLGSGACHRFWQVTERYGHWLLAQMEAILRLADHRVSERT